MKVLEKLRKSKYITPKELRVLELRFGFKLEKPMTLQEVGRVLGVTKERIRQVEGKALEKLRVELSTEDLTLN